MKKYIIIFAFVTIFKTMDALETKLLEYQEPTAPFMGEIIFGSSVYPDLSLYYQGEKIEIKEYYDKLYQKIGQLLPVQRLVSATSYLFDALKSLQKINILICMRPQCASHENTVTYWYVPDNISYKFYTLTASRKLDKNNHVEGYCWNIKQAELPSNIIPHNTILFIFPANFVEKIETKVWPVNSNVRILPTIFINPDLEKSLIDQAIIESRIFAIDIDTLHDRNTLHPSKLVGQTIVRIA